MIQTRTSPPEKSSPARAARDGAMPELARLVHEMANYLTVMNLCCFRVRETAAAQAAPAAVGEIEKMEAAVASIAALLAELAGAATAKPHKAERPRAAGKVYPLFKPIARR